MSQTDRVASDDANDAPESAATQWAPSVLAELRRLIDDASRHGDGQSATTQEWEDWLRRFGNDAPSLDTARQSFDSQPAAEMKLPAPLRIGQFELLSILGSGGFGIIFQAHDRTLNRVVALKILRPEMELLPEQCERFLREAKAAAQLEHPGIVPVHNLGTDDRGRPYFAMRLVQGESLGKAVKRLHAANTTDQGERQLALRKLLGRFVSVCQTIEYAHSRGMVHRDLKPDNIMLGEFGETIVVDWGMAKYAAAQQASENGAPAESSSINKLSRQTQAGSVFGTPAYMSPEQAAGRTAAVGPASDIYSLGATLFSILTGRSPALARQSADAAAQSRPTGRRAAQGIARRIHPALDAVCRKAMADQPRDRYASARELSDDIEQWLAGNPVSAWSEPLTTRARRWIGQHRALSSALAAAGAVALAALLIASQVLSSLRETQQINALIERIESAELRLLPALLSELEPVRGKTLARLQNALAQLPADSPHQVNLQIALVQSDPSRLSFVIERLLTADPQSLLVLRELLRPKSAAIVPELQRRLQRRNDDAPKFLRTAAALVAYDPDVSELNDRIDEIAELLVLENPLVLQSWIDAFQPIRTRLQPPLRAIFARDAKGQSGYASAELLAAFAADEPALLLEMLSSGDPSQLAPVVRQISRQPASTNAGLRAILSDTTLPPMKGNIDRDPQWPLVRRAGIRARAAVCLFAQGDHQVIWPLLAPSADPTMRSQLTHLFAPAQVDPQPLLRMWSQALEPARRQSLLLILGNYHPSTFKPSERRDFVERVLNAFQHDPDPGLHSAAEWLLRRWGQQDRLQAALAQLRDQPGPSGDCRWFVNRHGQTFAIIPGPVEFLMGSPGLERPRSPGERFHCRRIDRSFAILTREVTVAELAKFQAARPHASRENPFAPQPDCPAGYVRWFQAARYCRYLGELEQVPEDQQCFPSLDQIGPGMKLPQDYLERTGYRLPTAAEREYACRAGTISRTSFGNDLGLAPHYAWLATDSSPLSHPVAQLQPNDLGLFDMLGNVSEWVSDAPHDYRNHPNWGPVVNDNLLDLAPNNQLGRVTRGGAAIDSPLEVRSAMSQSNTPISEPASVGFRIARTLRVDQTPFYARLTSDSRSDQAVFLVDVGEDLLDVQVAEGPVDVKMEAVGANASQVQVVSDAGGMIPYRLTIRRRDTCQQTTAQGQLIRLEWSVRYYTYFGPFQNQRPTRLADYLAGRRPLFSEKQLSVNFHWQESAPHPSVPADNFVVVGGTTFKSPAGWYAVRCTADDGAYLEIDGQPIINPHDPNPIKFHHLDNQFLLVWLEQGDHSVRLVYHDANGPAELAVEIRPVLPLVR